ncbi:LLM class flavin-dependent oxidoreductase [Kitasatospora sp. NPDC057015]|uniref:LLM class flavin-dependent oxidoreductase n=1 Tax=Kitasatospora sp. NPDC057015 TaxID=3346001 RepID=UPI0036278677
MPVPGAYRARVAATARAAEAAGWSGILVPHNLREVDPWTVASYIGAVSPELTPLVAVQPSGTPPHTAAACAAAYAELYGRPLYFNLVAGARDDEMHSIGERLDHDGRYRRLREYAQVLRALLAGAEAELTGEHYTYRRLRLEPRAAVLAGCKVFIAGSSPQSVALAVDEADVVVTHPLPFERWREESLDPLRRAGYRGELGIRIGIVSRESRAEARRVANLRFPQTWLARQETVLKTGSRNHWARDLANLAVEREAAEDGADAADPTDGTYWLGAFRSGRASAPFLVGSYQDVGAALGAYLRAGVDHVLLNGVDQEDHAHTGIALEEAARALDGIRYPLGNEHD